MRLRYVFLLVPVFVPILVSAMAPARHAAIRDLIRENMELTRERLDLLDREPERYQWLAKEIKATCGVSPHVPEELPVRLVEVSEKYRFLNGDDPEFHRLEEWRRLKRDIVLLRKKNRLSQQLEMALESCKAALAD